MYLDESFESGIPNCPGTRFAMELNQPPMGAEISNGSVHLFLGQSIRDTNGRDIGGRESILISVREAAEEELPANMNVLYVYFCGHRL